MDFATWCQDVSLIEFDKVLRKFKRGQNLSS